MENLVIARVLGEMADLLEIKGENPFRVRAYRTAAASVADCGERVADLSSEALRELPGVGKDLAAHIREIIGTGTTRVRDALLADFPPTILDLLRLQGVGPKTVALLYSTKRIGSIDDLEQAIKAGALRGLRGVGPKKEELLLKAIAERRQHAGRHLLAEASEVAEALVAHLRERAPQATFDIVGSIRRGLETCGDIDILATGPSESIMEVFTSYRLVERILGRGPTKSSVLLYKGYQADLRLVPAESRGAALQYFTGSKAHGIALRDRALNRGLKLNEYGVYREDDTRIAGTTEEEVYASLGLAFVPPELREMRGEIAAAESGALPQSLTLAQLKGDVHSHTTETDGRDTLEVMAKAARAAGLTYLAVTDHSQLLSMANGLDEQRALEHARRIRGLNARLEGITLLAGIECDIRPDGTMDLADDCLAQLDIVIASVHSAFSQDERQMTDRLLRALESPHVDILGHLTGRQILRREAHAMAFDRIFDAAARLGVAIEINCQIDRLDLDDVHARAAKERGVRFVIGSDAHAASAFSLLKWGVIVARRAWLEPSDVLNTRPLEAFRASLRRNPQAGARGAGKGRRVKA